MKKENRCINTLKGFACLLVVLNHFHSSGQLGNIEYAISSFGVPIFFLVSGFFLYNPDPNKIIDKIPHKIKHSAILLVAYTSLYFVYNTYLIYVENGELNGNLFYGQFKNMFEYSAMKNAILYGATFWGSAQWFLVSLLSAYIVIFILYKLHMKSMIDEMGWGIVTVCFFIHIPVRVLLIMYGENMMFGVGITESLCVRNTWLDAIPCMILGFQIHKGINENKKYTTRRNLIYLIIGFLSILECVLEMFAANKLTQQNLNCVLYTGTIIGIISFFIYAVRNPESHLPFFDYVGNKLSMYIYFLHPIIGQELSRQFAKYSITCNRHIYNMFVFALSIFFSFVTYVVIEKLKITWRSPYEYKSSEGFSR